MTTPKPNVIDAVSIGNQHVNLGRWLDAIKAFELATTLFPADPNVYFLLGNAQHEIGRVEQAIANYQRAIELNHEHKKGVLLALNEALAEADIFAQQALVESAAEAFIESRQSSV